MNKMQRLLVALTFALTFGEASAFDASEQATIDALQQQIVQLQAQLAQLTSGSLEPADVVLISWAVVAVLAVGFGIKQLKGYF